MGIKPEKSVVFMDFDGVMVKSWKYHLYNPISTIKTLVKAAAASLRDGFTARNLVKSFVLALDKYSDRVGEGLVRFADRNLMDLLHVLADDGYKFVILSSHPERVIEKFMDGVGRKMGEKIDYEIVGSGEKFLSSRRKREIIERYGEKEYTTISIVDAENDCEASEVSQICFVVRNLVRLISPRKPYGVEVKNLQDVKTFFDYVDAVNRGILPERKLRKYEMTFI